MAYNYAKLNGKITEKCGTQAVFAEKMGLSERTISMKFRLIFLLLMFNDIEHQDK